MTPIRANDAAGAEFLKVYSKVVRRSEETERRWVARLREMGIKAAHPDDGWVDRERNEVHLCYPQFNDGLEVGDVLALGYHSDNTRLVEVTGFRENRVAGDERWYVQFGRIGSLP